MPPLRRVTSCSPSASARTVTAHSLKAIGIGKGLDDGGTSEIPGGVRPNIPSDRAPRDVPAIVTNGHESAKCFPHQWYRNPFAVASRRENARASGPGAARGARGAGSAERGAPACLGQWQSDGDADVELA